MQFESFLINKCTFSIILFDLSLLFILRSFKMVSVVIFDGLAAHVITAPLL